MASRTIAAVCPAALALLSLFLGGCLSSNPNGGRGAAPAGPTQAAASVSVTARATASGTATVVSQPQPGFNGTVISGVISFQGAAPPDASSLFLGLAKSADDQQPRTCIDAARDPINDVGQFYAQVACTPQPGDQLVYVLVIGPEGARNWHRGVVPMPADLKNVHIDVQQ